MAGGIYGPIAGAMMTEMGLDTSVSKDRVLDFYGGFRAELGDLMKMLIDDEAPLKLGNYELSADAKHGTAGTYLINSWLSEQEFIFAQLLDAYKFEQTLENKINNFSFS